MSLLNEYSGDARILLPDRDAIVIGFDVRAPIDDLATSINSFCEECLIEGLGIEHTADGNSIQYDTGTQIITLPIGASYCFHLTGQTSLDPDFFVDHFMARSEFGVLTMRSLSLEEDDRQPPAPEPGAKIS